MKTDTIFYQIFKDFPNFFFDLIDRPETNTSAYEFKTPEIKQRGFRLDGLFEPLTGFEQEPLYFVEAQCYKEEEFYDRLFAGIILYLAQYRPVNDEWYAIVIYERRSYEVSPPGRYQHLMAPHVRRFYLDELGEAAEQSLGMGILRLVVETQKKTEARAKQLIAKTKQELSDVVTQQNTLELIETIVLYKFPQLSREELETMLGLSEIKQTRIYQEAVSEGIQVGRQEGIQVGRQEGIQVGRQEGIQVGELQTKLKMVSLLLELGLTVEQICQRLELDMETVIGAAQQQQNLSE